MTFEIKRNIMEKKLGPQIGSIYFDLINIPFKSNSPLEITKLLLLFNRDEHI